jgi:tryptophan halogenase
LRRYSEGRGVERIEGKIFQVDRDVDSGLITALRLEGDRTIKGDLFLDCSGFRSLLLGDAMGVPFEDWSHFLPCDRAIAVPSERTGTLLPYTQSFARPAGWQWRIPLQHRTGNGHVYCSSYMADEDAERLLLSNINGRAIASLNKLRFKAGRRARSWEGNVVGIGLSSGFLEPLESTSIHLIQYGIQKLLVLFPSDGFNQIERDEYNRQLAQTYESIRDFIVLHYTATERDGAFWEYLRSMQLPDSLQHKLELYREHGRVFRYGEELFDVPSWAAVMIGQGLLPVKPDPVAGAIPQARILSAMAKLRQAYDDAARGLPLASDFIDGLVQT